MAHSPQRVPHATTFLGIAAGVSAVRVRQSTDANATKRGVHTSIIDAGWDVQPDNLPDSSGDSPIHTRAARTSLIDTQWDPPPESRVAHRSGPHRIDARAPRTSLIDAEWDSPVTAPIAERLDAPRLHTRRRLLALVDAEEELDPVITWFELDGPECLGLLEGDLD